MTPTLKSRRLHGRRGLKLHLIHVPAIGALSPPSRAAWIEIFRTLPRRCPRWSPPSRAAWIEISPMHEGEEYRKSRRLHGRRGLKSCRAGQRLRRWLSPPSRAAWIEIDMFEREQALERVAAFTGGVD